jgi:predicted methyltransferase
MKKVVFAFALLGLFLAGPAGAADAPDYAALLAAPDRADADKAKDESRKPAEVLALLHVWPGETVIDLYSFGGYYAENFARVVGADGTVYAVNPPPVPANYAKAQEALAARAAAPGLSAIHPEVMNLADLPSAWHADLVFLGENYHDLINDYFKENLDRGKINAAIYGALKPGGLYVIEDHLAPAGSGAQVSTDLHRGDPDIIRQEVLAAGFELVEENDALFANPGDDMTLSVFDPAIRGQTARVLFIFKKPAM